MTATIIIATIIVLVLYDIFAAVKWGGDATISTVTYRACQKYPIIAAALGALLYHLVSGVT